MNIFMIILKYGGDINRRPWNTVALPHHAFPIRERSRSILAAFASALYKEAASCKAQDAPLTSLVPHVLERPLDNRKRHCPRA